MDGMQTVKWLDSGQMMRPALMLPMYLAQVCDEEGQGEEEQEERAAMDGMQTVKWLDSGQMMRPALMLPMYLAQVCDEEGLVIFYSAGIRV